mmetsp:Transcript_10148/g.13205  ORF Transcript_10148/g.13205 Transcript_10148/m.13205 type:complete len:91 (-) Transcript_10148:133-405(-)
MVVAHTSAGKLHDASHEADYIKDYNIVKGLKSKGPNEEMQFVTTYSESTGTFKTQRVARECGDIIPSVIDIQPTKPVNQIKSSKAIEKDI